MGANTVVVMEYCRATPTECMPFFKKPVSSTTNTPPASPSVVSAYAHTKWRSFSAC
jgi:hypothetical protein